MIRVQLQVLKALFDDLSKYIEKARIEQEAQQRLKRQQQEQAKLWQQQYQAQMAAQQRAQQGQGQGQGVVPKPVYSVPPPVMKPITS